MAKVMAITFPKEMCEASDSLRGLDATVAEGFDERFDIISVQKTSKNMISGGPVFPICI